MRRREFVTLLGGAALMCPFIVRAQPVSGKVARIGFIGLPSADSLPKRTEAFQAGLKNLGYREGHDLIVEYRWAESKYDRLPALLSEMIAMKVEVIVTHGTPGAMAAKQATSTIPIVVAVVGDAVALGLVDSLSRPGGNVTGLTFFQPELNAKRLEFLKETMPELRDVGVLVNPGNRLNEAVMPQLAKGADKLGLKLYQFNARSPADFETTFGEMKAKEVRAFVVVDDAMLISNAKLIAALAIKHGLPSSGFLDYAGAGGLIAYGVDFPDMFRRSASYVDRILRGAKPADLPVEQATRFETILNLGTAKKIGRLVPPSLLLRADQVID